MKKSYRLFLPALLIASLLQIPSVAATDDPSDILNKALALEAEGTSLLGEHYRFEEALVSEESDRLMIFLSMPHGARVIIDEVTLSMDGKLLTKHAYSVSELMLFQSRATQLLYTSRISQGQHVLRVDVKVMQGKVLPMQAYTFFKEGTAKYVDVQITGAPVRQIEVTDW